MKSTPPEPLMTRTLTRAAQRYGDRVAFRLVSGAELSYQNLDQTSDEVAAGLATRGVGPRSVVLLSLPSGLAYVVAYAAAAKLGATTAGVNPRMRAREREFIVDTVDPDLILATEPLSDGIPTDRRVELVKVDENQTKESKYILRELRRKGDDVPALPVDPDRPTCICFTSGSTGNPRGAWFSDRQLEAVQGLDIGGIWGSGGHLVSGTAFAHVGVMTKLCWQLASGTTIHVMDYWSASELLNLVEQYKLPTVNGVAAQIALLMKEPNFDNRDLSSVKAIVAGAGPSPPALVAEARERFGAPYVIRYSSTESGGVGLGTALDADDAEALYTVGRPRPGVAAELRSADGHPVPRGEVGELWLQTPSAMSGYWNDPEGTAEALIGGWLRTGDLASIDEAGCFRLAGRTKEMFIRGGYNVYPIEVEAVLGTNPAVSQVAVVPRPDPTMGEVGVAVVVPTDPDHPPTLEDLVADSRERLSNYKLPEAIRIVDQLPLNSGDKLDRLTLASYEAQF
ncbi:MAG: class I adenylate-forming enzyme family protein [Acidimicrobiales bacterium]|nr:class I adenylate-forming enzyme family protein [Acidimicrobiales bacterium]